MNSRAERVATPEGIKAVWISYAWFIALITCLAVAEWLLQRFSMPVPWRVAVALVPIVPFVGFARAHWRSVARGDELARHMARETYVVAFYTLGCAFICVSTLKTGGLLAGFTWGNRSLIYTMIGSLAVGDTWSRWRYR